MRRMLLCSSRRGCDSNQLHLRHLTGAAGKRDALAMTLTSISAATTILGNAMKLLDSVREQAKGSKDLALKETISNLYNDLLDLKAAHLRIEEENVELRRQIAQAADKPPAPQIRQVGAVHYYYVNEEGPYCQPCYDDKSKLVRVTPPEPWSGGQRTHCPICHAYFQETKSADADRPIRLGGRRGYTWG
jgi:hypothetical protein